MADSLQLDRFSADRPRVGPVLRLHALDAVRGVLATVVVAHHATRFLGIPALEAASEFAVIVFFMMSGYVLALTYDGRWLVFMVKRLVRLWPVYAVCMVAGFAVLERWPPALLPVWSPASYGAACVADAPVWTLFIEVWMVPLLPVMFRLAAFGRLVAVALVPAYFLLMAVDLRLLPIGVFGIGIAAGRFHLKLPQRVPGPLLLLGRISYSLYLSHWIVFTAATQAFGRIGMLPAIPLAFVTGWLLWRWVERPSIDLSRSVARLF